MQAKRESERKVISSGSCFFFLQQKNSSNYIAKFTLLNSRKLKNISFINVDMWMLRRKRQKKIYSTENVEKKLITLKLFWLENFNLSLLLGLNIKKQFSSLENHSLKSLNYYYCVVVYIYAEIIAYRVRRKIFVTLCHNRLMPCELVMKGKEVEVKNCKITIEN